MKRVILANPYDIRYLSTIYKNEQIKEDNYRLPNEYECKKYLLKRWKDIYEIHREHIKQKTYYVMKGHIRRNQEDVFFRYTRNLSTVIPYLWGLKYDYETYKNTKSIKEKKKEVDFDVEPLPSVRCYYGDDE